MSLFTKVPTDETLAVVRDKLAADPLREERTCIPIDNLMEMLTFSVKTTYFGMGSDIYHQEEGLARDLPLSPVLPNILEKEHDNKLPFLDVLVTRTEQGFRSSVYRKPTFIGQYLNFNSHHPFTVKKGIVRCLQHRAKTISSDTDAYQEEMISLRHKSTVTTTQSA